MLANRPIFFKSWQKRLLTASMLSLLLLSNVAVAETATATANQATAKIQSHSVDDMAGLVQIGKQNEAVNETIFANEAINETLNHDALPNRQNNEQTATATQTTPKQSTVQGVDANKLILQNPVIDEAKILTAGQKSALEQKIRHIYDRGLAQPAVVIVSTTNGMAIFDYAMQVAERWQLGTKTSDNGLLIVVAVNDRKIQILTGYGLEGVIPDGIAKRIINEDITPYFKQGDYAGGINAGLNRIEERLSTDPEILKQADAKANNEIEEISPIPFLIMGLFIGMFLTSILGRMLGASVTAGGVVIGGTLFGFGFFTSLIIAILLFVFLLIRNTGSGGRGGVYIPTGGGFGGGGFGSGGYGGGGGGFGGGGAGGSW